MRLDSATSSPVVLPDGNVLFGRGHTYKLNADDGQILATYDYGWDLTLAVLTTTRVRTRTSTPSRQASARPPGCRAGSTPARGLRHRWHSRFVCFV
jgi:hypothetical protein